MGEVVSGGELHTRMRAAAKLAERAVLTRQRRDWAGNQRDHVLIARLGLVASELGYAADQFGGALPNRRRIIGAVTSTATWIISCATVLLLVAEPADPAVLAGSLAATAIFAYLVSRVVLSVWDQHVCRAVTADVPSEDADILADLQNRVESLVTAVDAERSSHRTAAADSIHAAFVWLNAAAVLRDVRDEHVGVVAGGHVTA